jgi:tetratricopeptide (TPR) repeat protein
MSQRQIQLIVIALCAGLVVALYFGGRTKPLNRSQVNKTRALKAESTSSDTYIQQAKAKHTSSELEGIAQLEASLPLQFTDSAKAETYKALSKGWNDLNNLMIGGIYAEKVATILNTEESWAIAGTTFGLALKAAAETDKPFCREQAIAAFKKAINLNPDEVNHQINLALIYVESPQPMEGITMLRDLATKNPENTAVLMALGQLSVRSGQYDKALERYQSVVKIDPTNIRGHYALGQVYQMLGNTVAAVKSYEQCLALSKDAAFNADIQQIIKEIKTN